MPRNLINRVSRKARIGQALGVVNDLSRLAALYGGTDKLEHGYMPHYERHLGPRRLRAQTVYEIGVGGYDSSSPGGSLPVWRDYLLRSTIIGIDIAPKTVRFGNRVRFEQADQSSIEALRRIVQTHGRPDVVIDDGSHVGAHIHASFDYLWPLLPSGGLYVVEDLSTSYYPGAGGADPAPETSGVGLARALVDDAQARDVTFRLHPEWGSRGPARHLDVAAVHAYPGIFFVEKAI